MSHGRALLPSSGALYSSVSARSSSPVFFVIVPFTWVRLALQGTWKGIDVSILFPQSFLNASIGAVRDTLTAGTRVASMVVAATSSTAAA